MELHIASKMADDYGVYSAREVGMMDRVNVNHLFYGLLALAREQITPADGIVREPILELKSYFAGEGIDLDATEKKLKESLANEDADLRETVLNKAKLVAEVLGDEEVYPRVIASVILDNPTGTIDCAITKGGHPETVVDEKPVQDSTPVVSGPDQGVVRKPASTPPVTPIDKDEEKIIEDIFGGGGRSGGSPNSKQNISDSVLKSGGHIFIRIEQKPDPQGDQVRRPPQPAKPESVTARILKTIAYFVFAVVVPFLLLMVFDMTAGIDMLLAGTLATDLTLVVIVLAWAALILNTISVAVKKVSPAGKAFVQFLIGLAFAVLVAGAAVGLVPYDPVPLWLKIVLAVVCLAIIVVSRLRIMYASGQYVTGEIGLRAEARRLTGTLQGMFFTYIVKSFIIPVIGLFVLSLFMDEITGAWRIVCLIYAFVWVYLILDYGLQSITVWGEESPYTTGKKRKKTSFFLLQGRLLALPLFGLYLAWCLNWWPLPLWLIIVCALYLLAIWLPSTMVAIKQDPASL